jgi:hypothetical protein
VLRVSLRRQGGRYVSRSGAAHGCGRGAATAAAECRTDLGQPRELLNIFEADAIGCHIITVTNDILNRLSGVGKDLRESYLDTVRTFYRADVQRRCAAGGVHAVEISDLGFRLCHGGLEFRGSPPGERAEDVGHGRVWKGTAGHECF